MMTSIGARVNRVLVISPCKLDGTITIISFSRQKRESSESRLRTNDEIRTFFHSSLGRPLNTQNAT